MNKYDPLMLKKREQLLEGMPHPVACRLCVFVIDKAMCFFHIAGSNGVVCNVRDLDFSKHGS